MLITARFERPLLLRRTGLGFLESLQLAKEPQVGVGVHEQVAQLIFDGSGVCQPAELPVDLSQLPPDTSARTATS